MASRGELEQRVMDLLWSSSAPLSVADVHSLLSAERELAYTTVMTVLDRLSKKNVVTRQLDGRAWLYTPTHTRVDLYELAIRDIMAELGDDDRTTLWERFR